MVASPSATPDDPWERLARLEQIVAALANKTGHSMVVSSGGLTITNGGGITIGPGGSIQLPAGGTIDDAIGDILFSADSLTGQRLSTPFLAIPASPRWDGNDGAAFRTGGSTGDYVIQAAHCTTETTLWVGTIPQVVHPEAFYAAIVGRVTGSTSTPTYRLYLNGTAPSNLVDTHATTVYGNYGSPQQNIVPLSVYGAQSVPFSLTIQADVTSSDYFACTFKVLAMCGN